jgi:NhaP-type Na+/H+ or K+/H+ antiporter
LAIWDYYLFKGLTNDALAVVAFSVVKTIVDQQYVQKEGGCDKITDEALCMEFHMCDWTTTPMHHSSSSAASSTTSSSQHTVANHHVHSSSHHLGVTNLGGTCVDGHGEIDIWAEVAKDIFGGIFIGLFMAWLFSSIMRRVRQPNINILLSITLVLDVIVVSNLLESSPAVACATAGLFLRAFGLKYLERRSQQELDIVWKFFEEAISGVFFLIIGLCIITDDFSVPVFFSSVIAIPVTLGARYCSVAFPVFSWNYFSSPLQKIPWTIVPTMTWGGIRGGSSVALALSLSPTEGRTTIFAMT